MAGFSQRLGAEIQTDDGQARQPLPVKGRHAGTKNFPVNLPLKRKVSETDGDIAAPTAAPQQNAEADKLADNGGQSRAAGSHFQPKDKQRIQQNIQYSAGADAQHGVNGAA